MAGWSRVNDGSVVDCAKTPKKRLKPDGLWVQLDLARPEGVERKQVEPSEAETDKYSCCFDRLLGFFHKEICSAHSYLSVPPMLGDEGCVNLFKLFLTVRDKGGYDAVSRNNLWDSVTEEIGCSCQVSPAVKLVYCKYLQALERWLVRTVENRDSAGSPSIARAGVSEGLMGLEAEFKGFLSEISDLKKKDEEYPLLDETVNSAGKSEVWEFGEEKASVDGDRVLGLDGLLNFERAGRLDDGNDVESVKANPNGGTESGNVTILNQSMVNEEERSGVKRKRDDMTGMLNWVNVIAKNPGHPVIGSLPEQSKWEAYADDPPWKQVFLAREALFLKRDVYLNAEQLTLQKGQKMHPSMYDDHLGLSYNLRGRLKCRRKLLSDKTISEGYAFSGSSSPGSQSDLDNSQNSSITGITHIDMLDSWDRKRIPVGPDFQADIQEWTEVAYESDSKWLGVRAWPLEKTENRLLIERDPIGKGRRDSCGCQAQDSYECVKFHTAEKRYKVKLELRSAFHEWKFDEMGEEVALYWDKDEEKRFESIVRANPISLGKRFWDHLRNAFPSKSRENLVSYYFNVFLMRCRGFQNRFTPADVNSDDDDSRANRSEHETSRRPGSIFYSPNKPRSNNR